MQKNSRNTKLPTNIGVSFFLDIIFKAHKKPIFLLALIPVVGSMTESLSPYLLKLEIDILTNKDLTMIPNLIYIFMPLLVYVFLSFIFEACMRYQEFIESKIIPTIRAELQTSLCAHIFKHPYAFFQDNLAGSIAGKIISVSASFENIYRSWQQGLYPVLLSFSISLCLMASVSFVFSAILFFWFAAMIYVSFLFAGSCINRAKKYAETESNFSGRIVDIFQNIITIFKFSKEEYEIGKLEDYKKDNIRAHQELRSYLLRIHVFQSAISILMIALMALFLINGYMKHLFTLGDFAYILSTSFWLIRTTCWASHQVIIIFREVGTIKKALDLIFQPDFLHKNLNQPPIKISKGEIEFNNVFFSYNPKGPNFSFKDIKILAGEKIGLVGKAGSGKTTFVNLIMRFFELNRGNIYIDKNDIKDFSPSSIRKFISVIPQDIFLFHRSIYDNIRYSNPQANKKEIIAACKISHCHEFISKLSNGYDTLVGEKGVKLSTGQRQQIAIARAFLMNSPILIIDEATSSVDALTEEKIQESLKILMEGRTTITIAHRLNTVLTMDRLLVFKDHKIIEEGTHTELLKKRGYYYLLWNTQKKDYESRN